MNQVITAPVSLVMIRKTIKRIRLRWRRARGRVWYVWTDSGYQLLTNKMVGSGDL